MKYGYYPGCCLKSTCRDFDTSIRSVFRALEIDFEEIKNWLCCGSSAVHVASRYLAVALALDTPAKAQKQGLDEILVPCAACYARFKHALHEIGNDQGLRHEAEETLKHKFTDKLKVIQPLELFGTEELVKRVSGARKRDLSSLKVVCYYGCNTRVPDHLDDVENPQCMERVMRAAGVQVLDWGFRTDCCGANLSITRTDIAHKLSHDILEGAREAGAEAIVVACPFCHMNLDARQVEIEERYGTKYDLPVYYYSQVLGEALGTPEKELMLRLHFVHPRKVMEKAG